ncbi:MAG: hypothetical protein CVU87_07475 [Firmicutes bacterium HGW-Firmicutes-12]|jgi:hypothetical protein|nr:MAG: hypothetical protein CVU87_07475 [Firmicutes bacterium HGW-Firmicutes-12]
MRIKRDTTVQGYINKNNQKNIGKTDEHGTDHMQWFYKIECLHCNFMYRANGSDIWQRKCPYCQGGRP